MSYTPEQRSKNSHIRWDAVMDRTAETDKARQASVDEATRRRERLDAIVASWVGTSTGSRAERLRRNAIGSDLRGRRRTLRGQLRKRLADTLEMLAVLEDPRETEDRAASALEARTGRLSALYERFVREMQPDVVERKERSDRQGLDVLYPWALGYLAGLLADLAAGKEIAEHRIARCAAVADLVYNVNAGDLAMAVTLDRDQAGGQ